MCEHSRVTVIPFVMFQTRLKPILVKLFVADRHILYTTIIPPTTEHYFTNEKKCMPPLMSAVGLNGHDPWLHCTKNNTQVNQTTRVCIYRYLLSRLCKVNIHTLRTPAILCEMLFYLNKLFMYLRCVCVTCFIVL